MYDEFLKKVSGVWTRAVVARPGLIFLIVLGFTLGCGFLASRIQLRTDFKELLPRDSQAVRDYTKFRDRIGGLGNFIVVIENSDFEKARPFVDDVVKALNGKVPSGLIRYIDYRITAQKRFFEKNKYLFVDFTDLESVRDRLKTKIEWEVKCKNPAYFDLEGECEQDPGFDLEDLEKKYSSTTRKYTRYIDDYYTSADGKLAAILVKPAADGAKISDVENFVNTVDPVIRSVDPEKYGANIRVSYTGAFIVPYEEYKIMRRDIASTAALCTVLVLASLVVYYGRFRSIFLVFSAAAAGMTWMFAFTAVTYGYLNSVTAFLGTIVLGNGINNAIVFFARYLEERRRGEGIPEALETSVAATLKATFVAAFTTTAAYAALVVSGMQGHKQFGVIGAVGIALCWLATYVVIPPLICLAERLRPLAAADNQETRLHIGDWIYHAIRRRPQAWLAGGAILTAAGAICLVLFLREPWEQDFSKIRSSSGLKTGHQHMNRLIMEQIFDLSLTPAAVLVDSPEDADLVVDELKALMQKPGSMIDAVRYHRDLVPEQQDGKLAVLGEIRTLLDGQALKFLTESQRREVERIRESMDLTPIGYGDVPQEIVRAFREKDGSYDKVVYVFPDNGRDLSNRKNLEAFVRETREIRLPGGRTATSASESTLVLDTVDLTIATAPRIILYSFILVALLVAATFPQVRAFATLMLTLLAALCMIFIGFYGLDQKLTFFNFIALPLTIGIGIDYGTNIYSRYEQEGPGSIREVIRHTGGAVLLCSLTTVIGYASLLIANNLMLVYFGWLCLIGELATVFTATVLLPAWLLWRERRKAGAA